jgi:hypothetical protein
MKKYVLGILLLSQVSAVIAQNNTANTLQSVINKTVLSNSDISKGLKEALTISATKATGQLAVLNGFYKDSLVKILMPAEAEVVSTQLKKIGLGYLVDSVVISMNRAAENACVKVAPVFIGAIKQMSFQEAVGILKGSDNAATEYLKTKASDSIKIIIEPIIENSLKQTKTVELWNTVFKAYNKIPFVQKVNPNLSQYVTEKTLQAVFSKIALEEKTIRTNSAAQTSSILKSVFGGK